MKVYRKYSFVYKAPFIKFSLTERNPGEKYAFYIVKNGKNVLMTKYGDKSWIKYDTGYEAALWRVTYFIRSSDAADWGMTHQCFLNDKILRYDQESGILDGEFPDKAIAPLAIRGAYEYNCAYFPAKTAPEKLLIFLPAGVTPRTDRSRPIFFRWLWAQRGVFPGRVLAIANPFYQLFSENNVGFLTGPPEHDVFAELAGIVRGLADKFGIKSKDIYFYGSSSGGYSAIALASYFDDSTAIAANSLVKFSNFHDPNLLENYRKYILGNRSWDEIYSLMGERLVLLPYLRNPAFRVFFRINLTDEHHYRHHFLPAWKALGGGAPSEPGLYVLGRHMAQVFSEPGGHFNADTEASCREVFNILAEADAAKGKESAGTSRPA
ncbi:MAG: hypothetical protein K2H64_05520 [Desulfovibrio sp.]|nr:hypothetical protein [Desulfovibrio sp.]